MKSQRILGYLSEQMYPWVDSVGRVYEQLPLETRQSFLRTLMKDASRVTELMNHDESLMWQSSCSRLDPGASSSTLMAAFLIEAKPQFDPDEPCGHKHHRQSILEYTNRIFYAYLLSIFSPNGMTEFHCWCEYFYLAETIGRADDLSFTAALILRSEYLLGITRAESLSAPSVFDEILSELFELVEQFVARERNAE